MTALYQQAIDELLQEPMDACRARESCAFDRASEGYSETVIFGAGGLGRKVLGILRESGIEPVAFADNKLAGALVADLPVLTPAEAVERYGRSAVFVVAIWASWNDTGAQISLLRRSGCKAVVPFNLALWRRPDLLPHVQVELPSRLLEQREDIRRCYGLWADERSRKEFIAQLRWRLYADYETLTAPVFPIYWQTAIAPVGASAVYVDGGAFDGDTIEQFVDHMKGDFRKIYAFEPDCQNFALLTERIGRLPQTQREKIKSFRSGLSDRRESLPFQHGLGASSSFGGDGETPCEALDDVLEDPPGFIKLDIEGFEPRALEGAARVIRVHAPTLAVCVYHAADHLWKIPRLIHAINPEYHLYLRPHGEVWETVCYATADRACERPPADAAILREVQ